MFELSLCTHLYYKHKDHLNLSKPSIKTSVSTNRTLFGHLTQSELPENGKLICILAYLMLYIQTHLLVYFTSQCTKPIVI